ncbi:MAG: hypothetical protein HZC11_02290 [Nitrospirae bacterium]|nr:hypothetical protein [Nitrospirota bacterium]
MERSNRIFFCIFLIPLLLIPATIFSSERQSPSLTKETRQKLKRIAGIIASEITKRNITTVTVRDFTDINGKPSSTGKAIAGEFTKQMAFSAGKNFSVMSSSAEVVITGTVAPFKEDNKWQIKIKVVSSGTDKVITSYSGILKRLK